VTIPANLPEGTYHLYLWLPDKYAAIANDPRYAIRIANTDMWDAQTGMNDLMATVTISNSAPLDPGELPEVILNSLPAATAQACTHKYVENGMLYLVRDGVRYTVLGQ